MSTGQHHIKPLQAMRIEKEMKALKSKKRDYLEGYEKQTGDKEIWLFKIRHTMFGRMTLAVDCTGDYPFRAPSVRFTHPVYHPNVDKTGEVCLPIVAYDNWKPTTTMESIILSILQLLAEPDLARPVCFDIASEFIHDHKMYLSKITK